MSKFVTKDSGERQQFTSGMQRDTQNGKTLFHLVYDGPLLKRWAELLTRGAAKYSEGNWMKANGPEELRRFKASAARHFFQWYMDETDEDHAAAVTFNINGAEFVKGKIRVENEARINQTFINNPSPGEGLTTPLTDAQAAQIVIDADKDHARKTQERFLSAADSQAIAYDVLGSKAIDFNLLADLDNLTKSEPTAVQIGVDYAKEGGDESYVYVVGLPGKQIFVIPEDLREDFENIMLAKDGEAVAVNDATLDLVRFNGIPLVYTPNLGASPLDPKPYNEQYVGQSIPPSWNPVVENFKFAIRQEDRVSPFLDLMRQRMFDAQLALAENLERKAWDNLFPRFENSCSVDPPFNFFQRLLIKLQDLYQDVKSLVAKKLYDAAVGLDPEVTYEDVEA